MHYQIRSNTNIRRLHRLFVMEAALRRRRLRRSMSIRLRCAVSKRVILNCLITWSTRCALPHGSPPAICPHGTWELGGGWRPHACRRRPRMQISRRAVTTGASLDGCCVSGRRRDGSVSVSWLALSHELEIACCRYML